MWVYTLSFFSVRSFYWIVQSFLLSSFFTTLGVWINPKFFSWYMWISRYFLILVCRGDHHCDRKFLTLSLLQVIGIRTSLPLPSAWEIVAQITVYFLLEDYGNYWIHRWLHSEWGYNNIHYMHHEYTAPISLAAPYAHWAEILLLGLPSFVGPALVPCHMVTLWLWIVLRQVEAIDTHSGWVTVYIIFSQWVPLRETKRYGMSSQANMAH